MKKTVEGFVFGEMKVPDWFNKEANSGRIKLIFDEEDQMVAAQILSGTKVYEAKVGDSILNTKYGIVVIPREKAKQYGVQKKDDVKKETKEEKTEE